MASQFTRVFYARENIAPSHPVQTDPDFAITPALCWYPSCRPRPELVLAKGTHMPDFTTLRQLFEAGLRDIYDAEHQIKKALPKVIKAVTAQDLRDALASHLDETHGHVERLEQVFESVGLDAWGRRCAGMAGILEEGSELLAAEGAPAVLDAGFIAECQRVEHYEISAYGSLMAWAKILGYTQALELLKANEDEEKAADSTLTKIAEAAVNLDAAPALESSVRAGMSVRE